MQFPMIAGCGEAKRTSPGGADFSFDMQIINQTSLKDVLPKRNKSDKTNDVPRLLLLLLFRGTPQK